MFVTSIQDKCEYYILFYICQNPQIPKIYVEKGRVS